MIDWNDNGKIDPVDVGVSVAISQEQEADETIPEQKKPSFFEHIRRWVEINSKD